MSTFWGGEVVEEPTDGWPSLVEYLRGECQFVRSRPRTDDDSAIWLSVAQLETLLDMAERVTPTEDEEQT